MRTTPQIERIIALVAPCLEGLGFALVRVRISAQRGEQTLQVMAEPLDEATEMTVEDCALISRHLSALLDVEEPVSGAYRLEISSPGIDRPLLHAKDFARFIGHEAQVEMEWPVAGRKRFRGEIVGVEGDQVRLQLDAVNEVSLDVGGMQSAKLALTEKLIKRYGG